MKTNFEDHCWNDVITPDVIEIYKGYQRDVYVGEKPALVLIDLYEAVFAGGRHPVAALVGKHPLTCGEFAWNAIAPTMQLLTAARRAGFPIIHVTAETRAETDTSGGAGRPTHHRSRMSAGDYAFKQEFSPESGEIVVYKRRASGFHGTLLSTHLVRLGIRAVIIAGETTSGCVRATAVDSYSGGYHTVVVEECCFDRSLLSHKVNLFDMHHKYADVMHLDAVLSEIRVSA